MSKKVTHEMYVERLSKVNPNIEVVEEYKGYDTKIKHKCKIDGFEWYARPGNILNGRGCPECKKNKSRRQRTKTHEQYILELKEKKIDAIPLEEYKGNSIKIKHKCLKHDYVWETTPSNVLHGKGCPICKSETIKKKKTKDTKWYKERLAEKNIQIIPLEEYITAKTKIKHLCLKHNVEWYVTPDSVLRGSGCPQCGKEKLR